MADVDGRDQVAHMNRVEGPTENSEARGSFSSGRLRHGVESRESQGSVLLRPFVGLPAESSQVCGWALRYFGRPPVRFR